MPKKTNTNKTITLAEFLNQGYSFHLLSKPPQLRLRTLAGWQGILGNRILPVLGATHIDDVQLELPGFIAQLLDGGLHATSVHTILRVLKLIIDAAHLEGHVRHPLEIPAAHTGRDPIACLTVEATERLLAAALDDTERLMFRLMTDAGLRFGELRSLRWRDFQISRPAVAVDERLVPLGNRLLELLQAFPRTPSDSPVFARNVIEGIGRRFRELVARATLTRETRDELRPHDLRRLFGIRLLARAVPVRLVCKWMGVSPEVARALGFPEATTAEGDSPPVTFEEERAVLLIALESSGRDNHKA